MMSMDRCGRCENLIDTDVDVDCYITRPGQETICRCRSCRDRADPREPDYSRSGIFITHNCSRCRDGTLPCSAWPCEFPHARND